MHNLEHIEIYHGRYRLALLFNVRTCVQRLEQAYFSIVDENSQVVSLAKERYYTSIRFSASLSMQHVLAKTIVLRAFSSRDMTCNKYFKAPNNVLQQPSASIPVSTR
jgi:hypothetical protein